MAFHLPRDKICLGDGVLCHCPNSTGEQATLTFSGLIRLAFIP